MVVNRPGRHPRLGRNVVKADRIIAPAAELAPASTQQRLDGGLSMAFAK
jgi:hypothetical protein